MKKIVVSILMILLMQNFVFAVPNQSNNSFPVELEERVIPPGGDESSDDGGSSGLSGGAVTAITLGSIGAVALLGGLAWFLKPYWAKGLTAGYASGIDAPIFPVCLDRETVDEMIVKYQNYPLLTRALKMSEIHECPRSKYVLIPDTLIQNGTFNTTIFKLPTEIKDSQGYMGMKVIQVSSPYNNNELEGKFHFKNGKDLILKTEKESPSEGVVIKNGRINLVSSQANEGVVVTSYKSSSLTGKSENKKYAYLIEFYQ